MERARDVAKERAEEAAAVAKELAERAAPVVKEQAEKGRALVDEKLAERKAAQQARAQWYLTEAGPVHTAGYPDDETMRQGIQSAAEHGWTVQSIARVPERRLPGLGLAGVVAKQAAQRVMQSDRLLVTFQKAVQQREAKAEPEPPR